MLLNPSILYRLKFIAVLLLLLPCSVLVAQKTGNDLLLKTFKKIKNKDSSEMYARQLIALAQKNHDQLFEAQVLYTQSMKVFRNGDDSRALDLARQATKLTSVRDPATYTSATNMIAYMLGRQGKNVEALSVAFDMLRKTDANGWKKQGILSLNCISDLYREMGDPQKALPYALRAAKDAESLKDTAMYTFCLSTLSNLYSTKPIRTPANLQLAAKYQEMLLAPPYLAGLSDYTKAQYLGNLGRIYENQGKFSQAEALQQQSIAISRANKFIALEKHSLNELTTCEIDLKNYKKAIDYSNQALAIQAGGQGSLVELRNIYSQLTKAYKALGDYKNALDYTDKFDAVSDSISNADKDKAATELAEKYNADKRLLIAADHEKEATLQRDFIIAISVILLLGMVAAFRWLAYKDKREAALLNERHRQLARLDAMKTRFFANISHELRTPLTLIIGPTEQLLNKKDIDGQEQQGYLLAVARNGKKLLNMVNELLDLGKIEAGTLSVKLKPVDLGWFMNVIYQGFASSADYKNINYTITNAIEAETFVQLDADKFEKIANNLLSNAIKFTPTGGSVHIAAAMNEGLIEFTVTDTGRGIHPDDVPLIFDRYYQGNRDEALTEGGTGIGLAIAQEFAELMGGTITVKSTFGAGAIFKASIPKIAAANHAMVDYAQFTTETIAEVTSSGGEKLVMLVEDHREMAQYISSIVRPFYRVVTAFNGKEALDMLKTMPEQPDLIITDVMMPEMDGFALLYHLKHDAAYFRIPVIILTALGDNENRLKALNTGVDDYLTKPFISSELLARAGNLIRNAGDRLSFTVQDEQEFAELPNQETNPSEDTPEKTPHVSPADLVWLADLEELVRKYIGKTDLNIAMLSDDMAISERQLFRRIKDITGLTPNKYIRAIRLQIAREAIESGRYRTISEISYVAGFETPAYFSKLFKEHYGRDVNELL